jgi:ABC-type transport system involved in cytochrome bd biosynthesis fused ATPase/permease subunit
MVLHILLIILKIIGIIIAVLLGLILLFLVILLCVPVRYRMEASMPGEIKDRTRARDVAFAPDTDRCIL